MKIRMFAAGVLAVALVTGCGSSSERWCEYDATDTVVDDSFCTRNIVGYEWETGSHSRHVKRMKAKTKTSPAPKMVTPKRTTATRPGSTTPKRPAPKRTKRR